MRKITIHREKSIAGCAEAVSIYTVNQLDMDRINIEEFLFLGKIKNGHSLESEISRDEVTIIAAYDNLGVFMITDYVVIPQGNDDVILTGKVKLNPFKGNPFFFKKKG